MKYAYKIIDDAGNLACHQSENPSPDYPFVFDTPLEAGSRIINEQVVLPETPTTAPAYTPTAEEIKQQKFAEVNWEYQDKLRKLRDTINAVNLQQEVSADELDKRIKQIKTKYNQAMTDYKEALLKIIE